MSAGLRKPPPLTEYAQTHWSVRGPDGRRSFSFDGHEYLRTIYEDESREIVFQKSAQCGISEFLVCRAVYLADVRRRTGLFAHPKDRQLNDFAHARVDPPILHSDHLKAITSGIDNVGLKEIGGTFLYFRGTQNEDQINSVDADFVFADEMDRMNQAMIPKLKKRMGASDFRHFIAASVPSFPNYGIAKAFTGSDGCEWFIKCRSCGKFQTLSMKKNVIPATNTKPAMFVCAVRRCRKPIDNAMPGEWVPARPKAEVRGYHISKLMSSKITAKELIQSSTVKADHFNYDLGLPHTRKGGQVNHDLLDACRGDYGIAGAGTKCFLGVDVGSKLNWVVGPEKKIIAAGTAEDFEELDRLMKVYDVSVCVIDALPETREAKRFAARFRGRVWIAYYVPADRGQKPIRVKKKERDQPDTVLMDRTQTLDLTFDGLISRETKLPEEAREIPDFYDQISAPLRIERRDSKTGNMVPAYDEMGNPDHYAHGLNYWTAAQEIGKAKGPRILSRGRLI